MKERISIYKQRRELELRNNSRFSKTKHFVHQLMHLFLAIIAAEWIATFFADGFSLGGFAEIAVAVALHIAVEVMILHGLNLVGGMIIILDVILNSAELLREQSAVGISFFSLHTFFNAMFLIVLLAIGLTVIFNSDIRWFSRRSREIYRHLSHISDYDSPPRENSV
ncbi:MAG: hypothetical protein RRZ42_04545 [Oscillospiraceae bacterium]